MIKRKKSTKKKTSLNLHNQILFIGGQAYQLKKAPKDLQERAVSEGFWDWLFGTSGTAETIKDRNEQIKKLQEETTGGSAE